MKSAVRTVLTDRADEVGREANVVIFGLWEQEGEKVGERVGELFQILGEKPKFEAKRLGVVKPGDPSHRSVKVAMRSSAVATRIISKAEGGRKVREGVCQPGSDPGSEGGEEGTGNRT